MYTFKKEERLRNKKLLDELFHKGSSFLCYPFRVSYLVTALPPGDYPVQVVFPVARKRFKRAVQRNQIRRRIKEAYRLNKQQYLYQSLGQSEVTLVLSLSYVGKEILPYQTIEKKLLKVFLQLTDMISHGQGAANN
ncbi:ribonuclease P protein component [Mucilaginibacter sp. RS28]|uniref:Ribonuclease P protein component n=1 Tax=Mucilaginibacter straminoryzae TaxID=2932774 RepID=A0A9X1X0E0_9SPHI|nr:ribonuclease P protein component [Mucilaginibacter straminoryzae]MCJ8208932.1 ribonuclease P protein component [Mucilaginibacter straminoryzae]